MSLTIAYITARKQPGVEWFFGSFARQFLRGGVPQVIVIDHFANEKGHAVAVMQKWLSATAMLPTDLPHIRIASPKPTIWQGAHRLTKEDWWAKSNALNTAICLCETEWIAFVDDRSVLMPGWLDCIKEAMSGNYAVCGSYEKHLNLKVENGEIVDPGITDSVDHRRQLDEPQPTRDWYGGHGALQLEWCLAVNGFSEDLCDSLGLEDCMFGVTLVNNGFPICYDSRMRIIEDRTQGEIDGALKRTDKGVSPQDKSHAIVAKFQGATTSMNSFDIRELRERVLAGQPFPPPTADHLDWFDGQPIADFV